MVQTDCDTISILIGKYIKDTYVVPSDMYGKVVSDKVLLILR